MRSSLLPLSLAFLLSGMMPLPAVAGTDGGLREPTPPQLEALQKSGTKLTYLGNDGGVDAYLGENSVGKMQVFYITPDGKHMIAGLMFRADGVNVTGLQIARMEQRLHPDATSPYLSKLDQNAFFAELKKAAWFTVGKDNLPMLYMVVDPQCPYCHKAWSEIKDRIAQGKFSARVVMTSILDGSDPKAASILGRKNPSAAWLRGEGSSEIVDVQPAQPDQVARGNAALALNKAFASKIKLSGTPFLAYVGKDGKFYSIDGLPDDLDGFLAHLTD